MRGHPSPGPRGSAPSPVASPFEPAWRWREVSRTGRRDTLLVGLCAGAARHGASGAPRGCPVRTGGPPSGPDGDAARPARRSTRRRAVRPGARGDSSSARRDCHPGGRAAARHRLPDRRRAGRLPARTPAAGHVAPRPPPGPRPGGRRRHPPLRGGRGRARPRRGALRRPADDPAGLGAGHRGPQAGVRPPVPPDDRARAGAVGADRQRGPAGRGHAADQRLPHRRGPLRPGRPPPRLGGEGARAARTSTPTSSRSSRGSAPSARCASATCRTKSHERLFHERVPLPARARARMRVHDAWSYGIAGRGRRGVGLPRDAGARRVLGPPHRGAPLVRGRVRPRRRHAARGRHARRPHRGRRLPGAWPPSATACCSRTSGARTSSPGCATRPRASGGGPERDAARPACRRSPPRAPAPGRASATRPCAGRTGAACSC